MSHQIRILHTSDWHLGRALHERQRDDEYEMFLDWLVRKIEEEKIDVLLVAGDIFDTSNASHIAQKQYYNFCKKLNSTCCRHAVITSGNHDSTSFIDVPSQVLESLNVHVVGQARFNFRNGDPKDEVVVLKDADGADELIVAAVPYLAEGDVRTSEAGEDICTREKKVTDGIARHYDLVAQAVEEIRAGRDIPVVAMGHLFVQGGKMVEDDGVRVTYVGTLGGVNASIFIAVYDYVALGHLHVPQAVGDCEYIRYSGSPIAMGFGEAGQQKSVCEIVFDGKSNRTVSLCEIPTFHKMENICGDKAEICKRLEELGQPDAQNNIEEIYVSVTYNGAEPIESVTDIIEDFLEKYSNICCLGTKNLSKRNTEHGDIAYIRDESIAEINEQEMFIKLLDVNEVPEKDRPVLISTYNELLELVQREG